MTILTNIFGDNSDLSGRIIVWVYQDFPAGSITNTGVSINAISGYSDLVLETSRIVNSAFIVRSDNLEKYAYSGVLPLFASKIKINTISESSITLNAIPHASYPIRIYYQYIVNSFPNNYTPPPKIISASALDILDNILTNQQELVSVSVPPYLGASVNKVFLPNETKDIVFTGDNFTNNTELKNLPTGYTQSTINSTTSTTITIRVTAPSTASTIASNITLSNHWNGNMHTITFRTTLEQEMVSYTFENNITRNVWRYNLIDGGGWLRAFRTTGNDDDVGQATSNTQQTAFVTSTESTLSTFVGSTAVANFYKGVANTGIKDVLIRHESTGNYAVYSAVNSSDVFSNKSIAGIFDHNITTSNVSTGNTNINKVSYITRNYHFARNSLLSNAFSDYPYFSFNLISTSSDTDNSAFVFHDSLGSNNSWADSHRGSAAHGALWALQAADYSAISSSSANIQHHIFGTTTPQGKAGYKGGRTYAVGNAAPTGAYSVFVR